MAEKIGIIAFAFGVPWNIRSNLYIADFASEKAREFNAPVYTQHDIHPSTQDGMDTTYAEEKSGNPPPTLRIARGAVQWAKKRGIQTLIIVAAKPQLWHALRDTKHAVREAGLQIEVRPYEQTQNHSRDYIWFCSNSTQKRTTSRWQWHKREIIVKMMPFWLYKRIAS